MYAKILIQGKLEIVTGLHIGTGGTYSAIGTADSPVVRDVHDHLPIIPGSSLKGKIRTLLARKYCSTSKEPDNDTEEIKKLFGSKNKRGQLIFYDLFLNQDCLKELREQGIFSTTEVKFENTIDRLKASANPRQIERVIHGCEFDFNMIYDAEESETEAVENIRLLTEGMQLLQLDYLGGNGSRGYGKVKFKELTAQCMIGDISQGTVEKCTNLLKGVEGK